MTVYIANVELSTDTFGQWVDKTNYIIAALSNNAVTVNSNTAVGDAGITGSFTANTIKVLSNFVAIGNGVSNTITSSNKLVLQTSTSTNNIITSTGMIIDGVTQYTKTFATIGNTVISGANITADSIFTTTELMMGNTRITPISTATDTANSIFLNVSNTAFIGDVEANVVINRYGVAIYSDPTGSLVLNSYMTATDLWIDNIHAKRININGASSNTEFSGNVIFYGANNYFKYGLTANGDVKFEGGLVTFNSNTLFNGVNNYFTTGLTSAGVIDSYDIINADAGITVTDFIQFNGSSSGYTRLKANTDTNNVTFTLPVDDGNAGDILFTNGAGKLGFKPQFTGNSSFDFTARDITARSIGVGTSPAGTAGDIRAIGNITAYYSSDRRLKENITNITDALTKLQAINGVEFDWTDAYITQHGGLDSTFMRKHDVGVIAQEVEAILPEVVVQRSDGYKAVKYEKIIALLIEAIKELKAEVYSLKNGN